MMRALLVLLCLAGPAAALEPDEILADPALEARARELSKGLRCPVCQNESIDDSNAAIAGDLRVLLRERLVAGDTDAEAVDFIVARYGEYVLLNPPASGVNLILWIAGPLMLILGGGIAVAYLRGRGAREPAAALTAEEEARLREITRR